MATRKEICDAFKAAKALTAVDGEGCIGNEWNGRGNKGTYEFICHALESLHDLPGSEAAQAIITERFKIGVNDSTAVIYSWLRRVADVNLDLLTDDNVQAYKHRWLDSVIKEFSK